MTCLIFQLWHQFYNLVEELKRMITICMLGIGGNHHMVKRRSGFLMLMGVIIGSGMEIILML